MGAAGGHRGRLRAALRNGKDMLTGLADLEIRLRDVQDDLQEVKARVHDTQDRVYEIRDRSHDTQDRVYDMRASLRDIDAHVKASSEISQRLFFYERIDRLEASYIETKRQWFRSLPPAEGVLRDLQLLDLQLLKMLDAVCRENGIGYWIDFGTLLGAVRHGGFIPWDDDVDICMMRADLDRLRGALEGHPDLWLRDLYVHSLSGSVNHSCQLKFAYARERRVPCNVDIFIYDYCDCAAEGAAAYRAISRLKREHMERAWELHDSLSSGGMGDELSDGFQSAMRELFDSYGRRAFDEAGLTMEGGREIISSIDNAPFPYRFQSNGAASRVFPLCELEYEGVRLLAPRGYEERLAEKYGDYLAFPNDISSHSHFSLESEDRDSLRVLGERYLGGA